MPSREQFARSDAVPGMPNRMTSVEAAVGTPLVMARL